MKPSFQRRTLLLASALGAGTTLLQACGGGSDDEPERNIVQKAQANPELSILVEAVVAAGLADTLAAKLAAQNEEDWVVRQAHGLGQDAWLALASNSPLNASRLAAYYERITDPDSALARAVVLAQQKTSALAKRSITAPSIAAVRTLGQALAVRRQDSQTAEGGAWRFK